MVLNKQLQELETYLVENYSFFTENFVSILMGVGERLLKRKFSLEETINIIETIWIACYNEIDG